MHEIYRAWRSILDAYAPERIAVAEAWLPNLERMARYVRPDELHQAFNFEFLGTPGRARRTATSSTPRWRRWARWARPPPGCCPITTWSGTRPGWRPGSAAPPAASAKAEAAIAGGDPALGLRRARAAIVLMLALPGSVYMYQGEELGLPEVFDLPAGARQDPIFGRTGGAELGRDGCRVPLPWSGAQPPYGFGPDGSTPWLPQPPLWSELSVAAQQGDPDSTLALYRNALRLRRELFGAPGLTWLSDPDADVLVFERPGRDGRTIRCAINQGRAAVELSARPVLASGPLTANQLPPDAAVWWIID